MSHPSVQHATMILARDCMHFEPLDMEESFVSSVIEGWRSLQCLSLKSEWLLERGESYYFSIQSESLQVFSVKEFRPRYHTRFIFECPNLKTCFRTHRQTLENLRPSCDVSSVRVTSQESFAVTVQQLRAFVQAMPPVLVMPMPVQAAANVFYRLRPQALAPPPQPQPQPQLVPGVPRRQRRKTVNRRFHTKRPHAIPRKQPKQQRIQPRRREWRR